MEGVDPRAKDNFGQNVLDYAEWKEMEPVLRVLREEVEWYSFNNR